MIFWHKQAWGTGEALGSKAGEGAKMTFTSLSAFPGT